MHEMGIASSILDGVAAELRRRPGAYATKVCVRIGEMAGVDPDALKFAFEALTLDTPLEELELEIEYCARQHRCHKCNGTFQVRDFELACPGCGSLNSECI